LQVEGGHVDKQSHPNHVSGVIWDAIELDKAVGVGRAFARSTPALVVVTGDHDQSMVLNGVVEIGDADLTDRKPVLEANGQKYFKDSAVNQRSGLGTIPRAVFESVKSYGGHPDYADADRDGYPENREGNGRGRRRLAVGFRTGGHAASSVPVTAEGPGALYFTGYMDQTDLFFRMAASIGGDTAAADRGLEAMLKSRPPLAK
jgi:alkaline phosphatase